MTRRAHISDKTKLASALLALGLIDHEHAKAMGRDNFLSLFQLDHGILHGVEVNDEFWNLTPRLILDHREKSRKDTGIVAKVKATEKKHKLHIMKLDGHPIEFVMDDDDPGVLRPPDPVRDPDLFITRRARKIPARVNAWPPKGSRKIQSRGMR